MRNPWELSLAPYSNGKVSITLQFIALDKEKFSNYKLKIVLRLKFLILKIKDVSLTGNTP